MIIEDEFIHKTSDSIAIVKSVPCVRGCAMTYETDGHLMVTSEAQFLEDWRATGSNKTTANHPNDKSMIMEK